MFQTLTVKMMLKLFSYNFMLDFKNMHIFQNLSQGQQNSNSLWT
jgi:hypothetical protein